MRHAAQPAHDARLPGVDQPLPRELRVEQRVDAPVRRFLADEALHLRLERRPLPGRQCLDAGTHRIDEELLAEREAHRQRVEPRGAERVAAVPVALERRVEVDQQAANGE